MGRKAEAPSALACCAAAAVVVVAAALAARPAAAQEFIVEVRMRGVARAP